VKARIEALKSVLRPFVLLIAIIILLTGCVVRVDPFPLTEASFEEAKRTCTAHSGIKGVLAIKPLPGKDPTGKQYVIERGRVECNDGLLYEYSFAVERDNGHPDIQTPTPD
jgi:hypothetical protein